MNSSKDWLLSVIAPVYNEEEGIRQFYQKLSGVLRRAEISAEIIFVNDGSRDKSGEILKDIQKSDGAVKLLEFSRNFGHQIAVKAGIDYAQGDAVVIIDTDLQDPPEMILPMIEKWKDGFDVIYAIRAKREGETFFKKITAAAYYRLMKKIARIDIPLDAGDFRLISRSVADALRQIRERNPYIRGLVSWVGFKQTGIEIERQARFAGHTKYTLGKMLKFAWNGITHFSFLPLQLSTWFGFFAALLAVIWMLSAMYVSLVLHVAVQGWTSLIIAVLFLGSVQLITLGIMGSYLARNYDEARSRPLYIIKSKEGF